MGRQAPLLASVAGVGSGFLLPGQLPTFGQGSFWTYFKPGSFTVPAGVTRVRLRCHGGGGQIVSPTTGGTASVGSLISATGGLRGDQNAFGTSGGAGGQGFGGDFQASGGRGGHQMGGGGGAAGSTLGIGGVGGQGAGGGGGSVGGNAGASGDDGGGGGSPMEAAVSSAGGRDFRGIRSIRTTNNLPPMSLNSAGVIIPFPMFGFTGPGAQGGSSVPAGLGGGGSGANGLGHGIDGGGGGGGLQSVGGGSFYGAPTSGDTILYEGMELTRGCGGGGGAAQSPGYAGCGGGGFAYGVFAVTPGQVLPIIAGDGAVVIVEY